MSLFKRKEKKVRYSFKPSHGIYTLQYKQYNTDLFASQYIPPKVIRNSDGSFSYVWPCTVKKDPYDDGESDLLRPLD